jgi:hypothetical protein
MKRVLLVLGILLVLLGIVGLAHPVFTYHQRKEVAKLGPVQATVDEEKSVEIPRGASILVALAGLALILVAPRVRP